MPGTWDQTPTWDIYCDTPVDEECNLLSEQVYDPETAQEKINAHNAKHHPDEPEIEVR